MIDERAKELMTKMVELVSRTKTPPEIRKVAMDMDAYLEAEDILRGSSREFYAVLDEIAKLHDRKQQDYGTDEDPFANVRASKDWGILPWIGAMVRLNDKVVRLKRFARRGFLANESVEDSLKDIAVYALIALVLYREQSRGADG